MEHVKTKAGKTIHNALEQLDEEAVADDSEDHGEDDGANNP